MHIVKQALDLENKSDGDDFSSDDEDSVIDQNELYDKYNDQISSSINDNTEFKRHKSKSRDKHDKKNFNSV